MELKVLILDDESIILEGLCSFPWETYGCKVVGSACEGEEGLELAAKYQPDIILSDIKMPGMDGLEFSKRVKKEWPDMEIILLTGYDNFSFAQQALRIGVCEYLLKPVNFREVHGIIEKVTNRIFERRRHEKDYTELRRKYQQSIPLLRSKFISDLIYGRLKDHADMKARMELLNIRMEQYVLVYGKLEDLENQNSELEPGLFDFVVCNICKEFLEQNSLLVYSETDTLGYCFVVLFPKTTAGRDCENHCVQACEQIQENISDVIHSSISFGISTSQTDPYSLNMAYEQAVEACEQSVYMGASAYLSRDISDIQLPAWNITTGEKKRLFSELMRGNVETAKGFIDQIFSGCCDMEVMRYAVMELLVACFQYIGRESAGFHSRMEKNNVLADSMNHIYSSRSRRELLDTLKKTLSFLSDQNRGAHIDRNQQAVSGILEYIDANYGKDLSLDFLAEYFKISKTYMNRLLKSHTGKSFLEILLDCRMARAEQLISENNCKIYEVAEKVGYHDLSYFIKAFKKKYGVTPNAYRRI